MQYSNIDSILVTPEVWKFWKLIYLSLLQYWNMWDTSFNEDESKLERSTEFMKSTLWSWFSQCTESKKHWRLETGPLKWISTFVFALI